MKKIFELNQQEVSIISGGSIGDIASTIYHAYVGTAAHGAVPAASGNRWVQFGTLGVIALATIGAIVYHNLPTAPTQVNQTAAPAQAKPVAVAAASVHTHANAPGSPRRGSPRGR